MLTRRRNLPVGFIPQCLPIKAPKPPTGSAWLHESKYNCYRSWRARLRSSPLRVTSYKPRSPASRPGKADAFYAFRPLTTEEAMTTNPVSPKFVDLENVKESLATGMTVVHPYAPPCRSLWWHA